MKVLLVKHAAEGLEAAMPVVAAHLCELGIQAKAVYDVPPALKHRAWALGQKTAVVSLRPIERFTPGWATVYQQVWLNKIEEYRRLDAAGLPVPRWRPVYADQAPELEGFPEFVVVKPADAAFGAGVRVMRRKKVRFRPFEIKRMQKQVAAWIAQEYIHTGSRPHHYRVTSVFGKPVLMWHVQADPSKPAVDFDPQRPLESLAGKNIVSSAVGCEYTSDVPADAVALARSAHAAFPEIPLLGVDVMREEATGRLFINEVNASGGTFTIGHDEKTCFQIKYDEALRCAAEGIAKRMQGETAWLEWLSQETANREIACAE